MKMHARRPAVTASDSFSLADALLKDQRAGATHGVGNSLARALADLRRTRDALAEARSALALTEAALAVAQDREKQARLDALHDAATGLPNREHFNARLIQAIAQAKRRGMTLALMFFDLDSFKSINDTHGHAAGDKVLRQVADRLLEHCRGEDTLCRNGGDEFLYLLMDPKGKANIERIARAVRRAVSRPIEIGNVRIVIHSSIGVSIYPDDAVSAADLIQNADAAMYGAKRGKCGVTFFSAPQTNGVAA